MYEQKDQFNSKMINVSFLLGLGPVQSQVIQSSESFSSEEDCLFPFGANLEQDRKGIVTKMK